MNSQAAIYLHTITDLERISDHALNIGEKVKEMYDRKVVLTKEGAHEMDVLLNAVEAIVHLLVGSFITLDLDAAYRVEPLEECIDDLCDKMKLNHVERLTAGHCTLANGYVFNDLIVDLERISDHCSNTAAIMIELQNGTFGLHEYTNEIKAERSHHFDENYRDYQELFHF